MDHAILSKKKCQYLPVKDIDFTSARGKKRKLDDAINHESTAQNESQTMALHINHHHLPQLAKILMTFTKL